MEDAPGPYTPTRQQQDGEDLLPGTPTAAAQALPPLPLPPLPSPPNRASPVQLHHHSSAPAPSQQTRAVSFEREGGRGSAAGEDRSPSPGILLSRSSSVATVANGKDPTWPEWLSSAKEQHPLLMEQEIRSLHEMFTRHAQLSDGEEILTVEACAAILDEGLKNLFDTLDADHGGTLDRDELAVLIGSLGRALTSAELDKMMKELHGEGSGDVSFEEFRQWWNKQQYESDVERQLELRDLFEIVDTDGSGEIDWEEFLEMIGSQLERDKSFMSPRTRKNPAAAAAMVRTALESVRADVRAIYGTNATANKTRLLMMSQEEVEARGRRCFFRPDSTFRRQWDLIQVAMLFYVALAVPLRIGFDVEANPSEIMFYFEMAIDVYFWVDIVVQFRSGYYNLDKELIVDPKEIRKNYMRSWFPIDFVACLPVNYVELAIKYSQGKTNEGAKQQVKILKIFRMLRLAKLLRLARIKRLFQRLEQEYEGLAAAVKVQKIILTIVFVAHFVACFWYMVGTEIEIQIGETTVTTHADHPPGTPLYEIFGAGDSISNPDAISKGWVVKNGWDDDPDFLRVSLWTRYLDAFYFSVTTLTTVGFGDRTPFTNSEKVFSILAELAGSIIFGIIAGSMGALAMSTKMSDREMKYERERLDEFLKIKRISKDLRAKVQAQFDNYFDQKSVFDETAIMERLPPKHRKELLMEMYREHLATCPLLKGMEESIVSKLCLRMNPYLALRGDRIVKEGDVGEEMYMVLRGRIKLISERHRLYNGRCWLDGAFFGELTVLGAGAGPEQNRHVYTAEAERQSDCVFISQTVLDTLQILHPTFKTKMRTMAIKRAKRFGYGERLDDDGKGYTESPPESPTRGRSSQSAVVVDTPIRNVTPSAVTLEGHRTVSDDLDESMATALDTSARRSRATSGAQELGRAIAGGRESRQFLNLPSNNSRPNAEAAPSVIDRASSSQLQREMNREMSGPPAGKGDGGAVQEEVRLLRREVALLSDLMRRSLAEKQAAGP